MYTCSVMHIAAGPMTSTNSSNQEYTHAHAQRKLSKGENEGNFHHDLQTSTCSKIHCCRVRALRCEMHLLLGPSLNVILHNVPSLQVSHAPLQRPVQFGCWWMLLPREAISKRPAHRRRPQAMAAIYPRKATPVQEQRIGGGCDLKKGSP